MRWHDVSMRVRPGMTQYPGDTPFQLTADLRTAEGGVCNLSSMTTCLHVGTHVDAPWHFIDGGRRTHEIDTELFFGDALLIDIPEAPIIEATHLPGGPLPRRVLLKTRNSDLPEDAPFAEDYVAIGASAAQRLVEAGVRLVGVDAFSVDAYGAEGKPAHYALLGAGVLIVEGLRLAGVPAGTHPFVVLPMPIEGADGAPARAFICA